AVTMDAAAAGYGWFCGSTAGDTAFGSVVAPKELQAGPGSPAFGRMDLLTVVEHELGHVLGLEDLDPQAVPHDLLTTTLAPGVRRLPTPSAVVVSPPVVATPEAPAAPLVITPVVAAEAPADPLVVTAAAPAGMVAPAPDGSLLGGLAESLPATSDFAPPLPAGRVVEGQTDAAFLTVPLAPETEWLRAVAVARP